MRTPAFLRAAASAAGPLLLAATLGSGLLAQTQEPAGDLGLPAGATALEGLPQIRIDTTRDAVTRRELDAAESTAERLRIRVADGRLYWASRGDGALTAKTSDGYMYLSSGDPGRYVRIRRVNDRLTYVEHVDTEVGSVTFWGELRVELGR